MTDAFDLQRFVTAQDPVLENVLAELGRGRKSSHWMWFVFPQIAGLAASAMSRRYAISSLAEARAYLDHAVLGRRLIRCTELVLAVKDRSIEDIFGTPDNLKFRSSMTLFARARPEEACFGAALRKYFGGHEDEATLARLS